MNKSGIIGLSSFKKIISVIAICGVLFCLPLLSIAQTSSTCPGGPGTCNEPCIDNGGIFSSGVCPLDTWVWVLAAIAIGFAVFHLNRKQKSPLLNTEGIQ